ncbi:phosphotransferase [Gordonia polyisoprenivorans]|uniref:phosphotransferase n=1 Tax=Gordonia polyisoprenivorans TaxID=84595 RepID=UPI0030D30B46
MPWTETLSIKREHRIMEVLQRHGVPVPKLYGLCPAPEGILMDAVPGKDRFDDHDPQHHRDDVLLEYIDALVRAQDIDPDEFEKQGFGRPSDPTQIGLMGFDLSESWYRKVKPTPDPVHEFIIGWIRRNIPQRSEVTWVHFDAGQFLHQSGHMTAVMDVEFACLGDPLADLGAMRMRDTAQPIGNLTLAFKHYAESTGRDVDSHVVNFNAVRFAVLTSMLSIGERFDPSSRFDLAQWEAWSVMAQLICLTIIAEETGAELPQDFDDVPGAGSRRRPWSRSIERVLDDILSDLSDEDFAAFRIRIARDMAIAIGSADELADATEQLDRADEEALLGVRPNNWREADEALEQYVLKARPDEDTSIVAFLYQRLRRQQMILDPAMRDVRNFTVQKVDWSEVNARPGAAPERGQQ